MTVKFNIHFTPTNGEELYITYRKTITEDCPKAEALAPQTLKLSYMGNSLWNGSLRINGEKYPFMEYRYFVQKPNGEIYYEAGDDRLIDLSVNKLEIYNQWCGNTLEATALTAPFSEIFSTNITSDALFQDNYKYMIQTTVANVPANHFVHIVGSSPALGSWDLEKSIRMRNGKGQRWSVRFPDGFNGEKWEYKFVLYNESENKYTWEEGENRIITVPKYGTNCCITEVAPVNFGLPMPRLAGVASPVFSLRSERSYGVGDFKDLRLLIDWAAATGQSIIQLLPINDTTAHLSWMDSYPYNCISTLALHPLYINLDELGKIEDPALAEEFEQERKALNSLQFLDYTRTWEAKMRYCRQIFKQKGYTWQNNFKNFKESEDGLYIELNKDWLYPYAVFCTLRDHFKTADFTKWGKISLYKKSKTTGKASGKPFAEFDASVFSDELINAFVKREHTLTDEVYFYLCLQDWLYRQMSATKTYAHSKGVALKGDIPIGIARCSVEAWQYPHLFNFSQAAGAPPDFFSCTGQNWGFPTYNWEEMSKDNYAWWKHRLAIFEHYFDAYRIDHILGFFRIWEVPVKYTDGRLGHFYPALPFTPQQIREMGVPFDDNYYCADGDAGSNSKEYTPTPDDLFIEDPYKKRMYHPMISAKDGECYKNLNEAEREAFNRLYDYFFYSRHNEMWYNNAMRKLQDLIGVTNMLACGEDLGMLADSVIECMKNLKILSLELMIMPKQFGVGLGNPATYPYLSVCTTSTHDSETMRMWLGQRNGTIIDSVTDALPGDCIEILKKNLAAPSMLAIFPLQDWISIDSQLRGSNPADERINDPSNPHHYWRYRMHITLEELLGATWMNTTIKAIIQESGR